MANAAREGLARLTAAVESGEVAALCAQHRIVLLVVFGSALEPEGDPDDVDVAVRFDETSPTNDVLGLLDDLSRLSGSERLDLMALDRAGPVARERALAWGRPLFQRAPGEFAQAQIAAIMERLDTAEFRKLELELMSQ